ncbi:hypothetical protein [Streptomyces sp900116325]|uniref:hypothetical protein n=1 Tax=Streptomyces sp. 900116325 TaxID=3154295 RepID=UPI00331BD422
MHAIEEREGRLDVLVSNAGTANNIVGADGVTAESAHAGATPNTPKSLSVISWCRASDGRAAPPSGFLWGARDAP